MLFGKPFIHDTHAARRELAVRDEGGTISLVEDVPFIHL